MYFAKIDIFYRVLKVIVSDQDHVDTLPGTYIPCDIDGIFPKNYPGVGFTYDPVRQAFIAPKPYPSYTLDDNCQWQPPVPRPSTTLPCSWDEENLAWVVAGE